MSGNGSPETSDSYDPMYMATWQLMSNNNSMTQGISEWAQNYASFNTALQIRSTLSTDLLFRYDRHTNLLYINCSFDKPKYITIEYIPRYSDVSEIVSDFWIDILLRLSLAICK